MGGAPGGIRTPDHLIRSQVLYPLSYGRATASESRSGQHLSRFGAERPGEWAKITIERQKEADGTTGSQCQGAAAAVTSTCWERATNAEEIRPMRDSFNLDKAAVTGARATGVVASADAASEAFDRPADAATETAAGQSSALVLVPPQPAALVEEPQATDAIKLDSGTVARLDAMVADYVVAIAQLDIKDPKFEARISDIRKLGDDEIKASAQVSSRLLDRPVSSMKSGSLSKTSTVGSSLLALRRQIDSLDPGRQGDLFGQRKLLGFLPFGTRLRAYFAKYQSSQSHINSILDGLGRGHTELARDNEDLELEKANLWQAMQRLREFIYLAQKLDASLTARIKKIEATDPERTRVLKEDMLFYVRQKVQD